LANAPLVRGQAIFEFFALLLAKLEGSIMIPHDNNSEDEALIHLAAGIAAPRSSLMTTRPHYLEFVKYNDRLWEKIRAIDLSMVKLKLLDPEEGIGWSRDKVNFFENRYLKFLYIMVKYQRQSIVPTLEIDAFWHQHILDTQSYENDCFIIAGFFIHHYPYFGMNGAEDAANLITSFEITKDIYFDEFGECYSDGFEIYGELAEAGKCVKCGSGPVKCHHKPTRCRNAR
jgi:hypothetical protein